MQPYFLRKFQKALSARLIDAEPMRRGQVALGFLGFFGLALTGFRAVAGLMLRGLAVRTELARDDGSGRKCARQGGLSCDLFWIMQAVMRSTSGM
jgi:hypothetical protein